MTAILHAKELIAFANGETIEVRYSYLNGSDWHPVLESHSLHMFTGNGYELRIKPKTVIINGIEIPEPVRTPLDFGTPYYSPIFDSENRSYYLYFWINRHEDKLRLEKGLVQLTSDGAIALRAAMLAPLKGN